MSRTKSIIAAGSLTGLVLIAALVLGLRGINAASGTGGNTTVNSPAQIEIQQPDTATTADENLQSWQTYSRDLEYAVQTMQEREAAYQAQIEAANQAIMELQDQVNSANVALDQMSGPAPAYYDDDVYEHDNEYEYDDDEHEEHEDDD